MTIEQEKEMITLMIEMYEKGNHEDLTELKNYAYQRIDRCPRKAEKTEVRNKFLPLLHK